MLKSHVKAPVESKILQTKPIYTFSTLAKIGLGLASGTLVKLSYQKWVYCQEQTTRLSGYKTADDSSLKFDWKKFWAYLWPHIWYFIAAMAVRILCLFVVV